MTDSIADVSCRHCGQGRWVTNPDQFAWDGCPDCTPDPQPIFTPDANPLALAAVFAVVGLVVVALVAFVIARRLS